MRVILGLAILVAACRGAAPQAEDQFAIRADGRAIDGDTVSFDVRLFGADAFEKRQLCRNAEGCWPCGKAAQDFAAKLLKTGPSTIRLTGKLSYGRPIGTVEIDGRDLGETMIAAGLAVPATSFLKNDPERAERYVAAYKRAEVSHAGVHAGLFHRSSQVAPRRAPLLRKPPPGQRDALKMGEEGERTGTDLGEDHARFRLHARACAHGLGHARYGYPAPARGLVGHDTLPRRICPVG